MDFSIRPAGGNDIPGMCALLAELFAIEPDFESDAGKQAAGLSLLLGSPSGASLLLVAEASGEVIGMCSVQRLISTAEGGPVGLLEDLIVKERYRGNNVGTKLISEALKWCKAHQLSRLQLLRDLDNKGARSFYTGNGLNDTRLVCMRILLS